MSAIRNHPRMYIGGTNIKLYGWCLIVLLTLIPIFISINKYIFTPHQGLFFLVFPITLTVSLRGQPSAICYLPKKQCIGEPSPLPPSQSRSPNLFCFLFVFFVFGCFSLVPIPFQNPTQNKSSKMFV